MLTYLMIASAIDPDAAREMTDHLLDLAEEDHFDLQLAAHQAARDPDGADEYAPQIAAAAQIARALADGTDHRPLRMVSQRVLEDPDPDRDLGTDVEIARELALRADGARQHSFGQATQSRDMARIRRHAASRCSRPASKRSSASAASSSPAKARPSSRSTA